MIKLIVGILFALLISTTGYCGMDLDIEYYRDKTIEVCQEMYPDDRSGEVYCILSEFYAMQKVKDILRAYDDEQMYGLLNCLNYYYIEKFDTYYFGGIVDNCQ